MHQQLDWPQCRNNLRNFGLHVLQVRDIAVKGGDIVRLGGRFLKRLVIDVKDSDLCALLR